MSPSTTEAPDVTAVALDGAAIVQMLKPGSAKTFSEYAHSVFIPHRIRLRWSWKKSAWTTWDALPALTGALLELHNHPNKLCEDAI